MCYKSISNSSIHSRAILTAQSTLLLSDPAVLCSHSCIQQKLSTYRVDTLTWVPIRQNAIQASSYLSDIFSVEELIHRDHKNYHILWDYCNRLHYVSQVFIVLCLTLWIHPNVHIQLLEKGKVNVISLKPFHVALSTAVICMYVHINMILHVGFSLQYITGLILMLMPKKTKP